MRIITIFLLWLVSIESLGQLAQADFLMASQACIDEQVKIVNQSANAISFEWDFCDGDLGQVPQATVIANSFGGYGTRVMAIEDNGKYYGFFLSGGTRSLYRLDFGSNILGTPSLTDLGGLGLNSNQLRAIEIVKESTGQFYGFIIDSEKNKLYRIDFGETLGNIPQNAVEVFSGAPLNSPMEFSIVQESGMKYVFIVNSGDGELVKLKFNGAFNSAIVGATSFRVTNQWLNGIAFLKDGATWHCLIASPLTGEVFKLDYTNGLDSSSPAMTSIPVAAPMGVSLVNENGTYYGFVQSRNATFSLFRLEFGSSLDAPPAAINENKNIGYDVTQLWGYSMFGQQSKWVAFATESGGNNIYRLEFPNKCFSTSMSSNVSDPILPVVKPGSYSIALSAIGQSGDVDYLKRQLVVNNISAPDIQFDYLNFCSNNDVNFIPANLSGDILLFNWSFGDSQISTNPNPTHQYAAGGEYTATLQVAATNGCNNYVEKNVKIYNPPVSLFDSPTGLICTNNQFTFINNTVDNFDGNLSYEWFVNDELKSTTRDFVYAFATTGDQQVKLKTSIPGCFSEQTQTLLGVQSGPVVGFSYTGKCEDENILFTNESSGSISGFEWSFGNGNTSTLQNPTQAYTEYGQYDVTLNTTGTNGCVSSLTKKLSIYSVPQTDFMIELPPFSCAGTASQFRDLTPSMPDSNVSSWQWSFGDGNNGTATTKNPQYTFALASNYNVLLKTTTNFGCSSTTQKTITIQPSPKADFDFANACVKQSTIFTDKSTGDIKSWNWLIQNFTDTKQNTAFSFQSAGTYTASLKVTATNNCISQITKNVLIPVAPQVDFSAIATCKDIATTLTGITSGGTDPVTNWMWDFGDGFSGDGATTTHVYTKDKIYSVVAKAVGQSGCVYPYTDEISIIKAPVAKFTVPLDAGPAPFNVPVTNLSSLATKYEWRSGIAGAQVDNSFSPSFTYSQLGDYTLELRASNDVGCVAVAQQKISVVIPQISASMVDFRLERIPGNTAWRPMAIIKNNSNVAITDPEIFLDISGSGLVSEKLFGLIKPNQTDTLIFNSNLASRALNYVCAYLMVNADVNKYDDRECIDVASQFTSITPYPNPANEYVMLEWVSQTQEPLKVTIYNEAGQCVLSRTYDSTREGLNQVKVDVSQLRAGIYFITYELAGQSQHHRFSVVR